ncbi:MAG: hypothetical protein K2J77_12485 [Oscillospiraceae bacterium]|nr:hypothetical protein [Oscillospiraceae bacterium]
MAKYNLNQLKADVGLLSLKDCSAEENRKFAEMMKNGESLPDDIYATENMDAKGNRAFCRGTLNATPDNEQLFVLMRISKDLHFITVLIQVLLVLGVLGFVAALIFGQMG